MLHIDSTIKNVTGKINETTTAEIEYLYNKNVKTKEDGFYLLNNINKYLAENNISESLSAWYFLWLASINFFVGNHSATKKSLEDCENLSLNDEQAKLREKFITMFGFHEFYKNWTVYETSNFIFHYRKDENSRVDIQLFVESRENAFAKIQGFFNSNLHRKIDFFLWDSREEAFSVLKRHLGFAIGQYYLIHNAVDQSVGHEITHIITHYIGGAQSVTPLICEGAAVLFDQSESRNNVEFAKKMIEKHNIKTVDIKGLWENFFSIPSGVSYSVASVFSEILLRKFGKEKYIEIIKTQTYDEVCSVLGKHDLDIAIKETQDLF